MAFRHKLFWCILWITFVSIKNVYRATALAGNIGHKIEVCPKNTKEWQIASRRLNCTIDMSNPKNRYHCLPANDLSTLVELCYNETRLGVGKGSCMLYVQKINYLNGYNCSGFSNGCPDKMYSSDESYLFPRCSEIDLKRRCFVAEPSCRGKASGTIKTSHPASTEIKDRKDNALAWSISLTAVFLLVVIVIAIISNSKKGNFRQRILATLCTNCSELHVTDGIRSSDVGNDGIPFLPEDSHFLESAKECPNIFLSTVENGEPVDDVAHISFVTSEYICIDNKQWVMKIDHSGNVIKKYELGDFWGSASSTADENGDLLIIRQNNKVMKVKSNEEEPTKVLSIDRRWSILSVYFSRFSGEILLRIYLQKWSKYSTHLVRYNKEGKKLFEFEYHRHDKLIVYPLFLSENVNGDICIADNFDCHVIAFSKEGEKQYTYEGTSPHFSPTGICNDKLGNVLVCNCHESDPSVHLLNVKGQLRSVIVRDREDVKEPWGLCADDKGKLYLGQKNCTVIKVFRYFEE